MHAPPELQLVLAQVEAELRRMYEVDAIGEINIFIGGHTIQVESKLKRKLKPVQIKLGNLQGIQRAR